MKSNRTSLSLRVLLFFNLLLVSTGVYASRVIEGSLGSWIAQDVTPMLSKLLTHHPRFKGEPIKIMAMSDGVPIAVNNKLTDRIREQITEDLLTSAGVKIVFDDANRCKPIKVNTILGIEVEKHTSGNHRVSVAMVDIEEGIWLNGTNISWNGKLNSSQRRALNTSVKRPVASSILAFNHTAEIAAALYDQVQCNDEIMPPVFFEQAGDDSGQAVLRRLREKVSKSLLTTIDRHSAASIISLESPDFYPADGQRRLMASYILGLANIDNPLQVYRIGEVRVSQQGNSGAIISRSDAAYPNTNNVPAPDILSDIHIVHHQSRDNACEPRKKDCVDVSFVLNQPAYTVLFYSVDGRTAPLRCKAPGQKQRGKQHYGLNVPAGNNPNRPTVGFYVLAFKDRSAARQIHDAIRKNAPRCGGHPQPTAAWVTSFHQLLVSNNDQYRGRSDWRSIHLTRINSRIAEL